MQGKAIRNRYQSRWERKASISIHVFLYIHSHSTSLDGINYVPELVDKQVLEFTVANKKDIVPTLLEQGGKSEYRKQINNMIINGKYW